VPLTPEDVRNRRFKTAFRGYDEEEVDTFLDEVEVELTRLLGEGDTLRQRLEAAQNQPPPQPVASEAEEMLRRTLLLAQRTADETVAGAQADAERIKTEAAEQAQATLQAAQAQAAASIGDLERRRQALEQHIEGLRAFEREYRTRLKAYLESQLRDLEGRQGAPAEAPAPAAPVATPYVPPVTSPVSPVMAAPMPVAPPEPPADEGPDDVPDGAGDEGADLVPEVAYDTGEPEPFDIDEGGDGIPKLAP
jgi:DivIVA domain-containing protein